jgi:hypothetical protein
MKVLLFMINLMHSICFSTKASRARALYKAGLRTPQAVAEASVAELAKALFESSSWGSRGQLF